MNALTLVPDLAPAPGWFWRDRYGKRHYPSEMETRHIFFTLRMIWNHMMPRAARIHPFKPYNFGPFYSREYFADAIRTLIPELARRSDIAPHWMADLQWMQDWIIRQRPSLRAPYPELEQAA